MMLGNRAGLATMVGDSKAPALADSRISLRSPGYVTVGLSRKEGPCVISMQT